MGVEVGLVLECERFDGRPVHFRLGHEDGGVKGDAARDVGFCCRAMLEADLQGGAGGENFKHFDELQMYVD